MGLAEAGTGFFSSRAIRYPASWGVRIEGYSCGMAWRRFLDVSLGFELFLQADLTCMY